MRTRHLTDEALLEVIAKRLPEADMRLVEEHLEGCGECAERLRSFRFSHKIFERLAEVGLNEVAGAERASMAQPASNSWLSWGSAAAVGVASVLGFFLVTHTVPEVRASELLSSAIVHEQQQSHGFRILVGEQVCVTAAPGHKVIASLENGCDSALALVRGTVWGKGNPLSARNYAAWRSSLGHHRDTVENRAGLWVIRTATGEGAVHAASLEIRVADYEPMRLTLDFKDNKEISIIEDLAAPSEGLPDRVTQRAGDGQVEQAGLELTDALETNAWAALHRLNADTGWEATVLRNGSDVRVRVLVDSDERRREIARIFSAYPGVALDMHSSASLRGGEDAAYPHRANLTGQAPGLAESWLEARFTDPDQRMEFSNKTLNLSRHILGRAFFFEHLRRRRAAMAGCTCTKEMTELVQAEQQELGMMQRELAVALEPLLGEPRATGTRALSFAEAKRLDAALEDLLLGSSGADEELKQRRIEEVRQLL